MAMGVGVNIGFQAPTGMSSPQGLPNHQPSAYQPPVAVVHQQPSGPAGFQVGHQAGVGYQAPNVNVVTPKPQSPTIVVQKQHTAAGVHVQVGHQANVGFQAPTAVVAPKPASPVVMVQHQHTPAGVQVQVGHQANVGYQAPTVNVVSPKPASPVVMVQQQHTPAGVHVQVGTQANVGYQAPNVGYQAPTVNVVPKPHSPVVLVQQTPAAGVQVQVGHQASVGFQAPKSTSPVVVVQQPIPNVQVGHHSNVGYQASSAQFTVGGLHVETYTPPSTVGNECRGGRGSPPHLHQHHHHHQAPSVQPFGVSVQVSSPQPIGFQAPSSAFDHDPMRGHRGSPPGLGFQAPSSVFDHDPMHGHRGSPPSLIQVPRVQPFGPSIGFQPGPGHQPSGYQAPMARVDAFGSTSGYTSPSTMEREFGALPGTFGSPSMGFSVNGGIHTAPHVPANTPFGVIDQSPGAPHIYGANPGETSMGFQVGVQQHHHHHHHSSY